MGDDRAAESDVEAIARLNRELADLRTTVLARVGRKATGDIEPTILPSPKPDTLFLQGQTLNRADYPALWAWAEGNGAVGTGLFGAGNGTTTFVLPDLRGRVLMGAGALGTDTYTLGQDVGVARHTLATTEMPAHNHPASGSTSSHGHDHGWAGGHAHGLNSMRYSTPGNPHDHYNVVGTVSEGTSGAGTGPGGNTGTAGVGDHLHGWDNHGHTVTVSTSNTGGGAAHENRQPSKAVNWMIWT